jgi:peptidoglycan-associated lipoprotein
MNTFARNSISSALVAALLAGCAGYVTRDEFNSTVAELRSHHSAIEAKADANASAIASLRAELEGHLARYDKVIAEAAGRLRIDTLAHFDYDSSQLRAEDRPALDDFARVIREQHPGSLITIEGFADPAGDAAYNRRLGERRAEAVRDYLVAQGGLPASDVRAVSYGEARERQVEAGAWGPQGMSNRRAALVIDRVGS